MLNVQEFLRLLILSAEKAGEIARKCRQEEQLFKLLVQEKDEESKNPRFVQDFKTLADVLIQETLRYDISLKYPELKNQIYGEETNTFTNGLGDTVTIDVCSEESKTRDMLLKVLNDNKVATDILTGAVYAPPGMLKLNDLCLTSIQDNTDLPIERIGIWIDPIDSTHEYINGSWIPNNSRKFSHSGLVCVSVLLGVFDQLTGIPLLGVVNQPFHSFDQKSGIYSSKICWGYNINEMKANNFHSLTGSPSKLIAISGNESEEIIDKLKKEFDVVHIAGAGYKILLVALLICDAYVSTKSSTFKWDSCAPHALIKSIGGNILSFDGIMNDESSTFPNHELKYCQNASEDGQMKWSNSGGLIAYNNETTLINLVKILR